MFTGGAFGSVHDDAAAPMPWRPAGAVVLSATRGHMLSDGGIRLATSGIGSAYLTVEGKSSHAGAAPADFTAWACASGQPAGAVVRQYTHASAQEGAAQLPAGGSALLCGSTGYGYRHILARHQGDWARLASGSDWSGTADRAVADALGQPERVGFRASNDTFCFSHALGDGNVTMVVVRESDGAIITAYPARHQCDPTG